MRDLGPGALEFHSFGDIEETLIAHDRALTAQARAIVTAHQHMSIYHEQLKNLTAALKDLNSVLQHCDAAGYRAHTELADRVELLEEQIQPSRLPGLWAVFQRFFSTCTSVLCRYPFGAISSTTNDSTADPTREDAAAEPETLELAGSSSPVQNS